VRAETSSVILDRKKRDENTTKQTEGQTDRGLAPKRAHDTYSFAFFHPGTRTDKGNTNLCGETCLTQERSKGTSRGRCGTNGINLNRQQAGLRGKKDGDGNVDILPLKWRNYRGRVVHVEGIHTEDGNRYLQSRGVLGLGRGRQCHKETLWHHNGKLRLST